MNCKLSKWLRSVITTLLPTFVLATAPLAHAALIGVQPFYPDITTNGFDVSNTFTPGVGGTLTINGNQGSLLGGLPAQVGQSIKFFPSDTAHNIYGCSTLGISTTSCATPNSPNSSYVLTANLNASGAFISGTLTILGYIDADTTTSGYQAFDFNGAAAGGAPTGTLLTADLTAMGFNGSVGASAYDLLKLDFTGMVTGGDFYNSSYDPGNLVSLLMNATRVYSGNSNPYAAPYGQSWDNVTTPFTKNFACGNGDNTYRPCLGSIDTYIPIPAAAWLFGSGLLSLLGIAARSRKQYC